MVEIAEVTEEETPPPAAADDRSQEWFDDADEIEALLSSVVRPSARLHVENLVGKLRREGKALRRVAASRDAAAAMDVDDEGNEGGTAEPPRSSPKDPPIPKRAPAVAPQLSADKYQAFPTYLFDAGKYDSKQVSVYVPLDGIGSHDKSKIACDFTQTSFDLIVSDWDGKSYRLLNDNLEKDIDPAKSKLVIKANKIVLRLGKVKGEYGFESWQQLTAKKKRKKENKGGKEDPTAGIMDMMKDMYESGDDNMRKMIGETMYKQRTGQLGKDGMGGMGGMGGMDDMMGMGGMGGMGL